MADEKISAMTSATSVANADVAPIVQGGANFKATRALFLTAGAGEDIILRSASGQGAALLSDDGLYTVSVVDGSLAFVGGPKVVIENNGSGTIFQLFTDGTGTLISCQTGFSINFVQVGGGAGQLGIDYFQNKFSTQGWSLSSIQYVTSSTHWQISNPVDFENAIDRLAAAVDGLLGGGGIP